MGADAKKHLEVAEVWPEGTRVRFVVDPAATVDAHADVRLVARRRETREEVVLPAPVVGGLPQLDLDLTQLVRDTEEQQLWDLGVRVHDGDGRVQRLPLATHARGPVGKLAYVGFPAQPVSTAKGSRSFKAYYTRRDTLAVSSQRLGRELTWEPPEEPVPARRPVVSVARRAAHRALLATVRPRRRKPPGRSYAGDRPPVDFLLFNAYAMGGTVRTVLNIAGALAERGWQVRVLSVLRHRDRPFFPVHRQVRVCALVDTRPGARLPSGTLRARVARVLRGRPSLLCHPDEPASSDLTAWSDLVLVRRLRSLEPGVLVTTRPALNVLAARFARPQTVVVGQEHMNFPHHRPGLRAEMLRACPRLDALAVLTAADRRDYATALQRRAGRRQARVVRIPNALPPTGGFRTDLTAKVVVAVGRLTRQKGYDRLLEAWQQVSRDHPDAELRIFGSGPLRWQLRQQIADLGLYNSARLMGRTDRVAEELARASVYVLSSRYEGFPMVLLEAMSVGLPVVSFDCPRGPSDLLTSGVDGILVPEGDVDGLAREVCGLLEDPGRRAQLGAQAARTAQRYAPERVVGAWEELFARLWDERVTRPSRP